MISILFFLHHVLFCAILQNKTIHKRRLLIRQCFYLYIALLMA